MAVLPHDPLDVAAGARLRFVRLLKGMSQDELARAVGVTFQQIQKYEAGVNRVSASAISRMSRALETPVAVFFGEAPTDAHLIDVAAETLGTTGAMELLWAWSKLAPDSKRLLVELMVSITSATGD